MATVPEDWKIPSYYHVKKLIGHGSYGDVFEAFDTRINKSVAIKRVHGVFDNLVDCKRILREVSILSRISHECLVKIYDVVVPENLENFNEMYIVFEFCRSDLGKLLIAPVLVQMLQVKTMMYNICVGTGYLHSAGIFHRDLKPANCLLNLPLSVKICDFGLSRSFAAPEGASTPCAGQKVRSSSCPRLF